MAIDVYKLKKQIENSKDKVSELKGRRNQLHTTLEEYGCADLVDAENKISSLKRKAAKLNKKKQEIIKRLEDEFDL